MVNFANMIGKAAGETMDRVVLSDFNCNMLKQNETYAAQPADIALEYGLIQIMICPTRHNQTSVSMIDLLFTTNLWPFSRC